MNHSGVSVVIPTYNSMLLLKETLDSLVEQTLGKELYEVIVVDDGSRDGTRYLVDEYREQLDISYYYLEDRGFRLAAARNIGIRFARYPTTLVFDCGLLAAADLLALHYDFHRSYAGRALIGLSYGVEEFDQENADSLLSALKQNKLARAFDELDAGVLHRDCRYERLLSLKFDLSACRAPWVVCWGGHLSCSTESLRRMGGFDEWFSTWGGEDVELAIRLYKTGIPFSVLPEMRAIHFPHFRDGSANRESSKKNIEYIIAKHPEPDVALLRKFGWEDILEASRPPATRILGPQNVQLSPVRETRLVP